MAQEEPNPAGLTTRRNTARFFVETPHVAWVLLVATVAWGVFGYLRMPQRKDPDVPVRVAVAIGSWPGASAERVERLVTRKIEETIAGNPRVEKIESVTRGSVAVVYVTLLETLADKGREFDDIENRLHGIRDLPAGAGPIRFLKDFGDTAALMLTVASPPADDVEIDLRARDIERAIRHARAAAPGGSRAAVVTAVPRATGRRGFERRRDLLVRALADAHLASEVRNLDGPGFVGFDAATNARDEDLLAFIDRFVHERLHAADVHPDAWPPIVVRDAAATRTRLAAVAGEKYSCRELDEFTDLIQKTLQAVPTVSKVVRYGVLKERIFLEYSQERTAAYRTDPSGLAAALEARNTILPAGVLEIEGKNLIIDPSGQFETAADIGNALVATSPTGAPLYLRDGFDIVRDYESPPQFTNFHTWRDAEGRWRRSRAVTLAVQMRAGDQIGRFGAAVDAALASIGPRLPADLVVARTSDQPHQVREYIDLFMRSLYEAIVLIVLVVLVGFWDWRSALLLALSIPLTLAMTFGMIAALGIDLQQVSIASLVIALGLLVDDPVVASDAIKRELAARRPRHVAAWVGPTRLARAMLFTTITVIAGYLPLLLVGGDSGRYIYSLPVVVTCALVASRLVSVTFVPLLGRFLLRPGPPVATSAGPGPFARAYEHVGAFLIDHRWKALAASLVIPALGSIFLLGLRPHLFPKDLSYLSYVDVWLPEDAPASASERTARRVEEVILGAVESDMPVRAGARDGNRARLQSITSFVGGGGPRFWFSVTPEQQQPNYAQLILRVDDKHDTARLVPRVQRALAAAIPGARVDVRELEIATPVGIPISIRISGDDVRALRDLAERVKGILLSISTADRIRDDWGAESFVVKLRVDADRANLAGLSNLDVAMSSAAGIHGLPLTVLREADEEIPVLARLRIEERARLSDIQNLYVHSLQGPRKAPLLQVSSVSYGMELEKLRRRNQFRTITVSAFPTPGVLPSEVLAQARGGLAELARTLPPGYRLEIGGEQEEQVKGFKELAVAGIMSVAAIFLVLVVQFRHAVKPLIVFAAVPYGMVGALAGLALMRAPFGYMAFLGIVALAGVIVSNVILLFDFIEAAQARGVPLRRALLDAGVVRLRPVLITAAATALGLFPLALRGGPLWEPLCYAQIAGLIVATVVTLLLVPVLYAVCVLDLKIVRWHTQA
jgi:multidrug efflux pump subunit AcrB